MNNVLPADTDAGRSIASEDATDAEIIIARANALTEVVGAHADETERLRRPADANCAAIRRAGIHRIFQPARFGGAEAPFRTGVEVLSAIGRGCGSTAWVLAQNITHNMMVSQWPQEAQETVWADPTALLSGILIPGIGKATVVDGGYRLSGRWPFVSGVDVCDFALFTAFVPDGDRLIDLHLILPREQFEIIDTWYAIGLKGSASNDVSIDDVFVPRHMTLDGEFLRGRAPRYDGEPVVFQAPNYAMFGSMIGSAQLGIAEGGVATYLDQAVGRVARMSTKKVADYNTHHVKVAEAVTCLKAARQLIYGTCDLATAILESGRLPTLEERAQFRAEAALAGQLSARAMAVVWDAGGGGAIYDRNPLSRYYRDISAAARHITQNWDANLGTFGRMKLGLPIDNPAL